MNLTKQTGIVSKEIIWNNSEIKHDGKLIYYQHWCGRGIKYIEHLYDFRLERFYTFEQMKDMYSIPRNDFFFKYYNIVSNIKSD